MRKGLSFVSIVVILLTVALLSLIFSVGRDYYLSAKVTKELSIIRKLDTALKVASTYMSNYKNSMNSYINTQTIADLGTLLPDNFKSNLGDYYYIPVISTTVPMGFISSKEAKKMQINDLQLIVWTTVSEFNTYNLVQVPLKYQCELERISDNENIFTGTIRIFEYNSQMKVPSDINFKRCYSYNRYNVTYGITSDFKFPEKIKNIY